MTGSPPLPPGTRISHYELLEPMANDQIADVYRARDTRLSREVAVRLLRPEAMARPDALERFRREAHIASLVTHPHVCTVHDSGEENGRPYLVYELLEGQPLDSLIAGTRLQPDRVLEIGVQIVDALAAAHRRGVVHGNLKPSNVFITSDGHAKLLELGAAAAAVPQTSPASSSGPFLDPQCDIAAVGSLLRSMGADNITGGREDSGAIAGRTRSRRRADARLPDAVEQVIHHALDEDPARRYATAAALLADLRRARCALNPPKRLASRWLNDRRVRSAALVSAAALVILAASASARWWRASRAEADAKGSTILVGDIANGTADPDFDGTLRQALTVHLAQTPYLELVSDDRILGTLQLMGRRPDTRLPHAVAVEVCQRLGIKAMLEGSVSAIGPSTVVALIATECTSGATIAREQVEVGRKEDVLQAMGRLSTSIRRSLGESLATVAHHNVPIEEATTPSMEALKAYTEAVAKRASGAETDAVRLLEQATGIDPRFALAYTTLSSIFGGFGETGRSEEYARLAFTNRSRVSERERLFITYQYHDRVTGDQLKARETLEVWKATYPRDHRPVNALAVMLSRIGEYAQAASEAREAMRRNPAHAFPRSNLAYAYRNAGRFAEARAVVEEALALGLETAPMRRLLYQLAELDGDQRLAAQQLEWASGHARAFDMTGARAQVAAFRGHVHEMRRLYAETIVAAREGGFAQVASGYASQAALSEALYGYRREAIARGREVLSTATAYEPQLKAATALALAGAPEEADVVVRRLRNVRPEDTLLHGVYLPVAEAAVLMSRGRFGAAVEELRRASPYERGAIAVLVPVYLRGRGWLSAGAAEDAAGEFREAIEHRGADPFSPLIPLSRLGLARALARTGAVDASRAAYQELLRTWAAADADLPVLREARHELSRLP